MFDVSTLAMKLEIIELFTFTAIGTYTCDSVGQNLTDCIRIVFKNPYSGTVSITNHGFQCQEWKAQYPHKHWYTEDLYFPDDGGVVGANNYCRQIPELSSIPTGRPWCHTNHPHIEIGFCDLQICNENSPDQMINVKATQGVISSPDANNDGLYDFNVDLLWILEAAEGKIIRYKVVLKIADALMLLSRLCGLGGARPPMETRTNKLFVEFHSDNYLTGRGFNLTFEAMQKSVEVCGESWYRGSGLIVSPDEDGDGYYDNNLFCTWHIWVAEKHVIRYKFLYFDVAPSDNCKKDRLVMSDPYGQTYSYCGFFAATPEGETLYDALFVEFYSFETRLTGYRGFEIEFVERNKTGDACGGIIRDSSIYISSPDLDVDGYYDFNMNCFWNVKVDVNSAILYQFLAMDIEETTDCDADYVRSGMRVQVAMVLRPKYAQNPEEFQNNVSSLSSILVKLALTCDD